jgi:PAS domain S-box-containing protein
MKRKSGTKRGPLVRGCDRARVGPGNECIYRLVADSSPDWEYLTDGKVCLLYSSPSCEPITGLTSEQMTADPESFYRIVHPDDLPAVLQHDSTFAGPKDPAELEFRIIHPTDGERWLGHVCAPLFDARGEFIGRRGTVRDITQRRRAERMLHMAQTILDHVGDMAFIVSEDGHIIYANNSACRNSGYTREELVGRRVREIEAGGVTQHWAAWWDEVRQAGSRTFESMARRKDGGTFPVEVVVSHVDFEGRGYHCGFARDIGRRKEAERALADSEARFRAMANTVPDMLYTNRPDGWCDYVNQQACDFSGKAREALVGNGWLTAYHPDDANGMRRTWTRSVRTGTPFAMEVRARAADGTYRWCMNRAVPIRDAGGKISRWFGAVTDIHDLKQAQEQLRVAQVTLEDKVRQRTAALQDAIASLQVEIAERRRLEEEVLRISEWEQERMGHDLHDDLCQQLAGIAYLCESVEPEITPVSPGPAAKVKRIRDLLNRALADARGMARGLSPLNLKAHGLRAAIKDLAAGARSGSGVQCRIACDDSLLRGDITRATHIYRIVQEAMHNAVRHGKAKSIHITLRALRLGFRLTVEDDGRGVPRRPRRNQGMGLGSMQYRARAMGGTFTIRRGSGGRGTVVTCEVPLADDGARAEEDDHAPGHRETRPRPARATPPIARPKRKPAAGSLAATGGRGKRPRMTRR